ncbi:MAG: hypothetical protein ABSC47_08635 [Terracidiphilus sp.]|jgi:hypothetical protein
MASLPVNVLRLQWPLRLSMPDRPALPGRSQVGLDADSGLNETRDRIGKYSTILATLVQQIQQQLAEKNF